MSRLTIVESFVLEARVVPSSDALFASLRQTSVDMGIAFFALTHHIDFAREAGPAIRLHNYPPEWQALFDERGLGRSDPVHRASHRANVGFAWSSVPDMIKMTSEDRWVLDQAYRIGIGDGFTVPAHIPGETYGSCSFAVAAGQTFPEEYHYVAQLIGAFAFEAARRLSQRDSFEFQNQPTLTARQRDCVLWAARGKTDWEISRILGVSHETVIQHLKHARERYGVQKRALLAIRALFDGLISFSDVLKH